jgi:hypothetical protein
MELTQAQRIFFDTMRAKSRELLQPEMSEAEFIKHFTIDEHPNRHFMEALLQAMDTYARAKWDEACNKVRFIHDDIDSTLLRHSFFTEGINPDFEP